jgi:chromosome segregation ATPase
MTVRSVPLRHSEPLANNPENGRTVAHLESEMDKLRSQLTTALTRWEAAEEEGHDLKAQLEAEKKLRLKAEKEQEELSSLLEAELNFD